VIPTAGTAICRSPPAASTWRVVRPSQCIREARVALVAETGWASAEANFAVVGR
jgi:hypothetical protein